MFKETKIAGLNAVTWTPDETKAYPTIIFFPGLGEAGSDISKLYVNGPAVFLKNGWQPNFNVVCVQPLYGWIPVATVAKIVDAVKISVKYTSLHATGLSAGASSWYDYISNTPNNGFKTLVPLSFGPTNTSMQNWVNYPPTWVLCGDTDTSRHASIKLMVAGLTAIGTEVKFTLYPGGHCCWNTYYDPTWKGDNGKSIYEWIMIHEPQPAPTPTPEPTPTPIPEPKIIMVLYDNGTWKTL